LAIGSIRGGGAGSGRSGARGVCPASLRRSRLQPAGGKGAEGGSRGCFAEDGEGAGLVEPAAQKSLALGDETEGRLRPETPANAADAADDQREPEAESLDDEEEGQDDQERGEERRQGGQQIGGGRLSDHRGLSGLGILEIISRYEDNLWRSPGCQDLETENHARGASCLSA
jgi:hypothetical protein